MSGKVKWNLFDTPIGKCGIAWDQAGLVGVHLPESSEPATHGRMGRRWPSGTESLPSAEIDRVIESIVLLLRSGRADFRGVRLNLDGIPEFNLKVYEITRAIPPGEVLTYGEIAQRLGDTSLARAVGQAMGQNRFPLVIPCHRVVGAGGKPGGFSGGVGTATKLQLLRIEGAVLGGQPSLFDDLASSGA